MTNELSNLVQPLLLSAPKEQRLNLAIACLLYQVQRELVEVALETQRRIVPVYCFFDEKRGYAPYYFSPEQLAFPPRRPGYPAPEPVPCYTSAPQYCWELQSFVHHVTRTSFQREVRVSVSDGIRTQEESAPITSYTHGERESCRLLVLATLKIYAPDVIPLLEAEQQEAPREDVLAGSTIVKQIQEIILAPLFLPAGLLDDLRCQYQEYSILTGIWRFCEQEWRGDEKACYPAQCPACGAYYCERHFSNVSYRFEAAKEERRVYGTQQITGNVCLVCALFPEDSVRRLRKTRLSINGENDRSH